MRRSEHGFSLVNSTRIPCARRHVLHFIPIDAAGEAVWVLTPETKVSERFSTDSGHTAQPGGLGREPQGCSRSCTVWSFSRRMDRGAAMSGQQSLLLPSTWPWERPLFLSKGPGGCRVHGVVPGVGGHSQPSAVRRPRRGSGEPPCGGGDGSGRAWAPRLGNRTQTKGTDSTCDS